MVPGSARNWIAVNAVQQFSLNQKVKTKNMTTLQLRKSIAVMFISAFAVSASFAAPTDSPQPANSAQSSEAQTTRPLHNPNKAAASEAPKRQKTEGEASAGPVGVPPIGPPGHTKEWQMMHTARKAGGSTRSSSDHAKKAVAELNENKADRHALLAAAYAKDTAAAVRILRGHGLEVEPGSVETQHQDGWCVMWWDARQHQWFRVCDHNWVP